MSKMKFHSVETEVCRVHIVLDDIHSVEWAMLAAMFSRSNEGALSIAEKVNHEKAERFQEKFYLGYGHESIGDLAYVKLFVEGIPFYVAAMLEHHSAFSGQESSTRYIDFSNQSGSFTSDPILYKQQIDFYLNATERVKDNIVRKNYDDLLKYTGSETNVHNRAIAARAFDITRCLLPLGATTNVAWYGTVRSIKRHLAWLRKECIYKEIMEPYVDQIINALRDVYSESIEEDPRPSNPWPMGNEASYSINGVLDFGSWRDLNRHRIGYHRLSIPSETSGFHPWYDKMLMEHGINYLEAPSSIDVDSVYLGNTIDAHYICNEEQFEYVCKLRGKPSVHPTLRLLIKENWEQESTSFGIDHTQDPGSHGYFVQRGNDTITVRT